MRAMTEYLAEHLPIIELLIEELRLSIKDHARELIDSLQLYGMDADTVRAKLDMLGMDVGELEETWEPSPQFYKLFRRIIRNRSTTGSVQTLVRTGGQLEASYRTLDEMSFYKNLNVYRDYQNPTVFGKDGYFYTVYDPRYPVSSNALIRNALPAGYSLLFVTQFYGFEGSDVIQYDTIITNAPLYKDPYTEHLDNDRVYISDFPGDAKNECDLVFEEALHEALHLSNVKGIMPQHDQGWSFGGLSVRAKTLGDLFRERDVRTQPKNKAWVETLNHPGTGIINADQHYVHAGIVTGVQRVRDDGLVITDSMQYHKDIIIAERQEFDLLHEAVKFPDSDDGFDDGITIDIIIPTVPTDVVDVGSFEDVPTGTVCVKLTATAAYVLDDSVEVPLSSDIVADIGTVSLSVEEMSWM